MSLLDVLIYSPYHTDDVAGNTVTAQRLARQLGESEEEKWAVKIITPQDELVQARCLIVLNAWRSRQVIERFQEKNPEASVVIILTGTDINHEKIHDDQWEVRQTMAKVDRLVVLQAEAVKNLPVELKSKCEVILPSVNLPPGLKHQGSEGGQFRVILAGRFRPEKRPELVLAACRDLPSNTELSLEWYGAMTSDQAAHFSWKGEVCQQELWQEIALSDAFLNASSEEGGANAVCEAIALGVPVIASRISGNIGLLGRCYPGYFEEGELSSFLEKVSQDRVLYGEMKAAVIERQPLFDDRQESQAWRSLVRALRDTALVLHNS